MLSDRDEDLVRRARSEAGNSAVTALLERYGPLIQGCVGREARRSRLGREDREGAAQEAFLALAEAVAAFEAAPAGAAQPGRFPTFLRLKVTSRIQDFRRRLRRREKQLDRSVEVADALAIASRSASAPRLLPKPGASDPAEVAEWQELQACVDRAVSRLGPVERCLVLGRMSGLSLQDLAELLGQPYHRIHYLWQRVRADLASRLRDCVA
jgi:RNA polymerase sigma factor (sigma-70 family)